VQSILKDIDAVAGVSGCFVCDADGRLLESTLAAAFDSDVLATVSRTITQTTAGLITARRRKVQEIDLLFSTGRVVVKPLREGSLFVLCARNINVPLLNLTANLAVRRLSEAMKADRSEATVVAEKQTSLGQLPYRLLEAYPDVVSPVLDFEQSLPSDDRGPTLTALGKELGAALFQRRYSSMKIAPSIHNSLELVVLPSISPFAIATVQGNTVDVLLCPFCRNLSSPSSHCHFLAGFIGGLLNAVPGMGTVEVAETLCRSKGDDTCTFVATKKA
jgi:predicted hydrocarbon binding protein/predicted regulator of Ras-like GTPase activity (Roadblock/LC7/MglB family)